MQDRYPCWDHLHYCRLKPLRSAGNESRYAVNALPECIHPVIGSPDWVSMLYIRPCFLVAQKYPQREHLGNCVHRIQKAPVIQIYLWIARSIIQHEFKTMYYAIMLCLILRSEQCMIMGIPFYFRYVHFCFTIKVYGYSWSAYSNLNNEQWLYRTDIHFCFP